jgi:ABC-type molybdate transport system substrate-binding protein
MMEEFPKNTHPPIIYLTALTTTATAPAATFLGWPNPPAAQSMLRKYGF